MSKRLRWMLIVVFLAVCTTGILVVRKIYLQVQAIEALDIQVAAREGDLEEVKRLLQADPCLVNVGGGDGVTALHMAVLYNHKDIAELLIANGANPNCRDREGVTPLQLAKEQGRNEIVELLRKHGAKE